MKTSLFDYSLSASFIAQQPAEPRDSSRLLVLDRSSGAIEHRRFSDIHEYLRSGDLLIAMTVESSQPGCMRKPTGKVEVFLLRRLKQSGETWECLVRSRPDRKARSYSWKPVQLR